MKIPINIESPEAPRVASKVFEGRQQISTGMPTVAPGGFHVTLQRLEGYRAFDIPSTLQFIVDTAVAVDVGLFSAWLYDKVKNPKCARILIREREVQFEEGDIKKAIEREIDLNK